MHKKTFMILFFALCFMGLAQCGGSDANSRDVKFTVVPDNPVVVSADIVINPGLDNEETVKGPWFLFRSTIANSSTKKLYVATLTFKGTNIKNGKEVTYKASIDPTVSCEDEALDLTKSRTYFAVLAAGQTYAGLTDSCDDTSVTTLGYEGWYMGGLPAADHTFYSIDIEGEGWFVDSNDIPIERLTMNGYLLTQ